MTYLVLGVILFCGIHLLPALVAVRKTVQIKLGAGPYKGLFSLLAVTGLGLMIYGMGQAPFHPVYDPPQWGRNVAITFMPLSFILFAAANMPSNIKRYTRHPMLWGLVLWSLSHLFSNGDLASIILFAGLGVYSLLAMASANRRGAEKQKTTYPLGRDAITLIGGVVVYGAVLWWHDYLFGVAVL